MKNYIVAMTLMVLVSGVPAVAQNLPLGAVRVGDRAVPAEEVVTVERVVYAHGEVALVGVQCVPIRAKLRALGVAVSEKLPAVLVIPEWWGSNAYAMKRAMEVAAHGYYAFVVDPYGEGKNTNDPKVAGQWAGALYQDRALFRQRMQAGLRVVQGRAEVDVKRIAAIGFCFGGTASVELALSGAELKGVVAFHGNPMPPLAGDLDRLKAHVFIAHGDVDPMVPDEKLKAFLDPLRKAGKPFTLVRYGGAVHSFTNPGADGHGIAGVKHDAMAERLAMDQMYRFFEVVLGESGR